jgi:hypothetical protein
MSQHTPGPWEIQWENDWCKESQDYIPGNKYAKYIRVPGDGEMEDRDSICGICEACQHGCGLISAPDARLIASAPDLLKILKEVLSKDLLNGAMLKSARAAIAKATGETK